MDIVVSHQGLPLKVALIVRLMDAVVVPAPDAFRPQLLRFVRLGELMHYMLGVCSPGGFAYYWRLICWLLIC